MLHSSDNQRSVIQKRISPGERWERRGKASHHSLRRSCGWREAIDSLHALFSEADVPSLEKLAKARFVRWTSRAWSRLQLQARVSLLHVPPHIHQGKLGMAAKERRFSLRGAGPRTRGPAQRQGTDGKLRPLSQSGVPLMLQLRLAALVMLSPFLKAKKDTQTEPYRLRSSEGHKFGAQGLIQCRCVSAPYHTVSPVYKCPMTNHATNNGH